MSDSDAATSDLSTAPAATPPCPVSGDPGGGVDWKGKSIEVLTEFGVHESIVVGLTFEGVETIGELCERSEQSVVDSFGEFDFQRLRRAVWGISGGRFSDPDTDPDAE